MSKIIRSQSYTDLLTDIKSRIQSAQVKAVISVNQQLLFLYWEVGREIRQRQKQGGWGAKVINQLSSDLRKEFPGLKGFSRSNLKYMQQLTRSLKLAKRHLAKLAGIII